MTMHPGEDDQLPYGPDPIRLDLGDELDLHAFSPREVCQLIPEYLSACREAGILNVRIVHGKGTGTLRRTVHAILDKLPWVEHYSLAPGDRGHWGATLVRLSPPLESGD